MTALRNVKHTFSPALVDVQRTCTSHLNRFSIRLQTWQRCGRRHLAPIDPLRLLWVDPQRIRRILPLSNAEYAREVCDVKDGDWDQNLPTLEEASVRYRSLVAHFQDQLPWEETELYAEVMACIEAGRPMWHNCKTRKDVLRRCEKLDALFDHIKTHGYKSQKEIGNGGYRDPLRKRRKRPPELYEIVVNVARNGEFIFVDGIHRLAIAKVLGIEAVPVTVLVRHKLWQEYRDKLVQNSRHTDSSLFEHPDLVYLPRVL